MMNVLQNKTNELNGEEKVPVVKKVARNGGTVINTNIIKFVKSTWKTTGGLFTTLGKKFKWQYNETILLL